MTPALHTPAFFAFEKNGRVTFGSGQPVTLSHVADLHDLAWEHRRDVAFVLPYATLKTRGFEAIGNDPIRAIVIDHEYRQSRRDFVDQLPVRNLRIQNVIQPSCDDAAYAALVARFQAQAIETGEVAQATLARAFSAQLVNGGGRDSQLALYRRLLNGHGQYMTVLFDDGHGSAIVGATPERHITITGNSTLMVPIAGTLRKEDRASFTDRLDRFIHDPKEINELFQVMDEEMKMMGRICPDGGIISGPYLREVGAVIHTEYHLNGQRSPNTLASLQHSLFAPTVVGSPLASAARQIARFEGTGRGTYAGVIGIYRCPETDTPSGDIDTAILIRCAELSADGTLVVRAGGGIVRDSDPANEALESTAKAMGFFRILDDDIQKAEPYLDDVTRVRVENSMRARNDQLSGFWAARQNPFGGTRYDLREASITIINNEDDFAYMIAHLITHFKGRPAIVDTMTYDPQQCRADLVIIGPGPGDPNDPEHPRMKKLFEIIRLLHTQSRPFFGICLGHQMLARASGIAVTRQPQSTQGMPRDVMIDGINHTLGFYNSFSPQIMAGHTLPAGLEAVMDDQGRIIVLRGQNWGGFQFHPESVMSKTGPELLYAELSRLLGGTKKLIFDTH